jgi:ABC-type dipeptide/oligopeptide/nickel transport system permease component
MEGTASYLFKRLLWVVPILVIVSFFTFVLARLGPGDPIRIAAGQFRDPEAFARVRHARGLDKPIYEQYGIYMKNVLTKADLGFSYRYQDRDVSEIIFPAMWRSVQYNFIALGITMFLGIPLGIYAARKQGTWVDPASIGSFLFLQSIPGLTLVPLLLWVFALRLGWLPARGWPGDCNVTLSFMPTAYNCIGVISKEALIPIFVLALPAVAGWARFTRAFTLGVMREDYIRTARSKGLSELLIMRRHVLRNALLPLSTIIIFSFVGLLEGSFFIEILTGIPGVGRLAFESIGGRDYDMIMAITLVGAFAFVIASIAVDIVYTFIDPRVRYGARRD